jgi:N-acetylmuramoyl-L-alanine amidase
VGDVTLPLFKVQLSATRKRVELVPRNFKGLNNVSVTYEGGVYKYMFGETTDYNEAKKYLSEAKAKGYASAFLIAFKNGAKVNIQDVIN